MPAPLSIDVRNRMLQAYDAGQGTQEEIARMFRVTRQCLAAVLRRRQQTGSIAPKPHGGGHPAAYQGKQLEHLRRLVQGQPDATLEELRERTGVRCSVVAVHNALVRLDLRFKKRRSTRASRTARR
jgi:transposase